VSERHPRGEIVQQEPGGHGRGADQSNYDSSPKTLRLMIVSRLGTAPRMACA
jgi:hypothetical protein